MFFFSGKTIKCLICILVTQKYAFYHEPAFFNVFCVKIRAGTSPVQARGRPASNKQNNLVALV